MAITRSAYKKSLGLSSDAKPKKIMLRFSKKQVDSFKRAELAAKAKEEEILKTEAVPETAPKATRPITRVVLNMWNGSKIAMYPAERLRIRCGDKVYTHSMKRARVVKLA